MIKEILQVVRSEPHRTLRLRRRLLHSIMLTLSPLPLRRTRTLFSIRFALRCWCLPSGGWLCGL